MSKAHRKFLEELAQHNLRLRLIDAKGWVVGRLAPQIATILTVLDDMVGRIRHHDASTSPTTHHHQGKDKPTFVPYLAEGDAVVVINTRHIELTRWKWKNKKYRWHTGYPGGLKERSARDQHARDPTSVLHHAVYGMLPKSRLRKIYSRRLRLFPDDQHDFENHPNLVHWQPRPRFRHLWPKISRLETPNWDDDDSWEPFNDQAFERNFWRPAWQFHQRQAEIDELVLRRALYQQWARENGEYGSEEVVDGEASLP